MNKAKECEDGCLVAEARGILYACQYGCAYAQGARSICKKETGAEDPMEKGDASWCIDPDIGAKS